MTPDFQPVYRINDWGNDATFIGPNKPRQWDTHDIDRQSSVGDIRIYRPCRLTVRWPDGTEEEVEVSIKRTTTTVGDMGHYYDVSSNRPVIVRSVNGAIVTVPLSSVAAVDVTSIVWTAP